MFNGRDLAGWKGLVENPVVRAKMTPAELAAAQAHADSAMRAHWSVVDGTLVFDGKGESLCTLKDYMDFEMLVDWKIEKLGDSGIYLRGSPQVQIWDPAQWPEGSGGLYNNQRGPSHPLVIADKPIGEWNTFRIRMVGDRVTVYLNNVLVVDSVALENYWDRSIPIFPAGQIELQSHNSPLYFRNVFIREIPRPKQVSGISLRLMNGKDLAGWEIVGGKRGKLGSERRRSLHTGRRRRLALHGERVRQLPARPGLPGRDGRQQRRFHPLARAKAIPPIRAWRSRCSTTTPRSTRR